MNDDVNAIVAKAGYIAMGITYSDGMDHPYCAWVQWSPTGMLEIDGDNPAGILAQALAEARRRVEGV